MQHHTFSLNHGSFVELIFKHADFTWMIIRISNYRFEYMFFTLEGHFLEFTYNTGSHKSMET